MLTLKPVSLADANAFVALHHRHHKPVRGHKYSLGCFKNGQLVWRSPGGLSAGIWMTGSPWRSTACVPMAPGTLAAFSMARRRGLRKL